MTLAAPRFCRAVCVRLATGSCSCGVDAVSAPAINRESARFPRPTEWYYMNLLPINSVKAHLVHTSLQAVQPNPE